MRRQINAEKREEGGRKEGGQVVEQTKRGWSGGSRASGVFLQSFAHNQHTTVATPEGPQSGLEQELLQETKILDRMTVDMNKQTQSGRIGRTQDNWVAAKIWIVWQYDANIKSSSTSPLHTDNISVIYYSPWAQDRVLDKGQRRTLDTSRTYDTTQFYPTHDVFYRGLWDIIRLVHTMAFLATS